MSSAWLLLAAGKNRQHGGNDGYKDDPETTYRWDSTVHHHAEIAVGDPVVLWDTVTSLGVSVVEKIDLGTEVKPLNKCPKCGRAGIKPRKTKSPRYQCYKCKNEFEDPTVMFAEVITYESKHDVGWVDINGVLSAAQLRPLCRDPKSQQSMRPLEWEKFRSMVLAAGAAITLDTVDSSQKRILGGHNLRTYRVRIGQGKFRQKLIDQFGPVCAFTGPTPLAALEAGHLYSYATTGEHHGDGGLLFRRDLHSLFDQGLIAINPDTFLVDVLPELGAFPTYQTLHGSPLKVSISSVHKQWLRRHWSEHRID